MRTKFRKAHFCATCWQELSLIDLTLTVYGCPHCGHALGDGQQLTRMVPLPRRAFFRTGLEPLLALWREKYLLLRARQLHSRMNSLDPMDERVPALRVQLACVETELGVRR